MWLKSKSKRFKNIWRAPFGVSLKRKPLSSERGIQAVMLMVGAAHEPLALNAITSFRNHNPNIPLTVYVHDGSAVFVSSVEAMDKTEIKLLENSGLLDGTSVVGSEFGTEDFNRVVALKWKVIEAELLLAKKTVLFFDTDVAFRRPLEDVLVKLSRKYPIGVQDEIGEGLWPVACTGFMFLTRQSLPFVRFMERFSKANRYSSNDQILLNSLLRREKQLLRKVYFFPAALFPTGRLWKQFAPDASPYVLGELEPFIFHANFVPSLDSKVGLLKATGNWSVSTG